MKLGDTIRRHREDLGMTIEQLALNTRLSVKMLRKIENNELTPDQNTLFKLSTALDIPISEYQLDGPV